MQVHIHTYGAYLHIVDDMFEIKRKEGGLIKKDYLAAQKVTSIWLSPGVALSSNAVQLAVRNNIDIVFLERGGFPLGRVWHSKLGSTVKIRKLQLEASMGEKGVAYTKDWVTIKLDNQADFLKEMGRTRKKQRPFLLEKAEKIKAMSTAVLALSAKETSTIAATIRGLEGTGGRLYFGAMSQVLPPKFQFKGRSSRPAADVFNALLNYAYGILYSRVEKALIVAGLDPYVGFLHRDDYNHKSLVFDFIEPFRKHGDRVAFRLCSAKKVNKEHWEDISNGVGLSKAGKDLLSMAFVDHFDGEKVLFNGKKQTHSDIMQSLAFRTAQELLHGVAEKDWTPPKVL